MRLSVIHRSRCKSSAAARAVLAAVLLTGCTNPEGLGQGPQTHLASIDDSKHATAGSLAPNTSALSDLQMAQRSFDREAYGLAERQFRAAIERDRDDPEAWLGLAASYDRLARYDLADRAYAELERLDIDRAILLNNRGFSHMLRGDYVRARKLLRSAQALAPDDEHIARNLALLDDRANRIVTGSNTR